MFQAWESEHGISVSPSIHFTGGEPFLYEGLWDVVVMHKGKGYGVALMTNGCLISSDDARRTFGLGVSDIQVSLEGPPIFMTPYEAAGVLRQRPRVLKTCSGLATVSVPM